MSGQQFRAYDAERVYVRRGRDRLATELFGARVIRSEGTRPAVREWKLVGTFGLAQQPGNAEGLPVETCRYDGVHNRIESGHQPGNWSYNGNNELLRFGEDAELSVREYDSQGLTISDSKGDPLQERTEYGYNAAERLSEVRRGTAQPLPLVATYQYDPFGRRMAKRVGGEATYFVYSEQALV